MKPFRSFHYFRNHVYDYHDNIVVKKPTARSMDPPDTYDDGTGYHNSDSEIEESPPNFEKRMEDIQRASAIWILKIRECNKLTQVATEIIIKNVVPALKTILSSTGPYGKLFSGLETHHRQLAYMRSHFKLVVGVKKHVY